jgi:sugar lactone lactonase YvrE
MDSKSRSLSIGMALALLAALLIAVAAPGQIGANGLIEVVRSYDDPQVELPEGIAVDKRGNLYVSLAPPGQIWKITPDGAESLLADFGEWGSLGLAVDAPGNVYFGHSSFNPDTHGVYLVAKGGGVERLLGTEAIGLPNALAFDKRGNLYVTDSSLGAIWRIRRRGSVELWLQHVLLEGLGEIPDYPPIGANGIAYRHRNLYVANTEKGLMLRIPILKSGAAGDPEIIAEGPHLYGLDGIALDVHGTIYAALVLQSKLVRINPVNGDVVELATAADGIDEPASLAFGTGRGDRQSLFVTNYAVMPPEAGFGPAVLKMDVGVPGLPLP